MERIGSPGGEKNERNGRHKMSARLLSRAFRRSGPACADRRGAQRSRLSRRLFDDRAKPPYFRYTGTV